MEIYFSQDEKKYKLSETFITILETETEFNIIRKIGEGNNNLILLVLSREDNKEYVFIINKNKYCSPEQEVSRGVNLISEMQDQKLLDDSIVRVYQTLMVNKAQLSDDAEFCSNLEYANIEIQVEEYIDGITLDEKIFQMSRKPLNEKVLFLLDLKNKMNELLDYIKSKNLDYSDFQTVNLMLRDPDNINSLTFIDVDAFEDRDSSMEDLSLSEEGLDERISGELVESIYSVILEPLTGEEKVMDYTELKSKRSAGLFSYGEIGLASAMFLTGYIPQIYGT
jgi:serine/threonine protein kinase